LLTRPAKIISPLAVSAPNRRSRSRFAETIRDNVILALPKLVEGMLVTSEFVDRGGNPDSYFEEYVAEVVAILSVEQQEQRLESTDDQKVVLNYELNI
jgi:hypothetical protein